mgnify:CR=1 FL=1
MNSRTLLKLSALVLLTLVSRAAATGEVCCKSNGECGKEDWCHEGGNLVACSAAMLAGKFSGSKECYSSCEGVPSISTMESMGWNNELSDDHCFYMVGPNGTGCRRMKQNGAMKCVFQSSGSLSGPMAFLALVPAFLLAKLAY